MNFGLIGVGGFGEFILKNFKYIKGSKVVAICTRSQEKGERLIDKYNIPNYFTSYEEMLKDKDIEAIIIATPPNLHFEQALAALSKGKHILLEKPSTIKLSDTKKLIEISKKKKLKVSIDYIQRFSPIYKLLFKLVEMNTLGNITNVNFENFASREGLDSDHWFWDKKKSGGIFVEHGGHFFDIYNRLLGKPKLISSKTFSKNGEENRVHCLVSYKTALASFTHNFDKPTKMERTSTVITFDHGQIKVEGWIANKIMFEGIIEKKYLKKIKKLFGAKTKYSYRTIKTMKNFKFKSPMLLKFTYSLKDNKQIIYRKQQVDLIKEFIDTTKSKKKSETSIDTTVESLKLGIEAKTLAKKSN